MAGKFQSWWYRNVWDAEERNVNLEDPKKPISGYTLDQVLGANVSSTGRSVSYNGSLTLSAVWRALTLKSGVLSMFPFQVFRKTAKGREIVTDHPLSYLLSRSPNSKMTKVVYFDRSMQHMEGWGNHIGLPKFNGIGRVESIEIIHPSQVTAFEDRAGISYKIEGDRVYQGSEIIHVPNTSDTMWGKSTVGKATEDLSMMMEMRDYGSGVVGKGGIPIGLFIPQGKVTPTQQQEMQVAWNKAKIKNRAVAMPYGWDYKQISLPPGDIAALVNGEFAIDDVARWFGTPPQKLFQLGRATYNNIEHLGIEFLQDTMSPITKRYEVEYTTKLLGLPSEQDMYLEMNMDSYLRADSVAKAEALTRLVAGGLRTPNEARELDNYEAKESGDDLMIQSATVPIKMLQTMMMSKTPQQRQSLKKKIEKQLDEGIDPNLIIAGLFNTNGNGKH